jgi:hypothetical protein
MTTFTQLYSSTLYQTAPQAEDTGWCGYVFNPAGGVAQPESGVSLQTLFSTQFPYGIFVFCSKAPAVSDTESANTFAGNIIKYLAQQYGASGVFTNYAMVWLTDPTTINSSTVTAVTLSYTSFFGVISPLSYNPSQNVELAVQSSAPCSLNGDLFNFFNTDLNNPKLLLTTQFGSVYQNPIQNIYIPTNGPLMGCLVYNLQVPSSNYNFPANQAALNYFYPGSKGNLSAFNYPMFDSDQTHNAGSYYVSLDPNNPLNANDLLRCFMVPMTTLAAPTTLPSGFTTDTGLQLGLTSVLNLNPYPGTSLLWTPTESTGMIVYADNQPKGTSGNNFDYVPSGQFSMSMWNKALPAAGTVYNLLCGLSGIETFSFQPAAAAGTDPLTEPYSGDILTFWPGHAAYAPSYVPPSLGVSQSGVSVLTDDYTTSWISIGNGAWNGSGNLYYSQPTGASLYAPNSGVGKTVSSLLGFFEPVACTLHNGDNPVPVPMTPYNLLELSNASDESDYNDFEVKVLSTDRKTELEPTVQKNALKSRSARKKMLKGAASDTLVTSTSPQGLLVEVDTTSNEWTELVLAKNIDINKAGNPPITMEFLNLNSTLQSAFQTNQQFLVVSWNKPLTDGGTDYILYGTDGSALNFLNEMVIEGWPFLANVPTADPNGVFTNVLIFKFCDGKLVDRISDSSTWTSPELFNSTENGNLGLLQNWLTDYCTTAEGKLKDGDSNYYYFSNIINDPNWNGILLLQSNISVQDFPPELQGLLAGIDMSRFFGHHMGINVNMISAEGGALTMSPVSSLFGLIDYTDVVFDQYNDNVQEYLENVSPPSGDYNYKVLSLRVLFENSVIQNFNSYVQLAINSLFGCSVGSSGNENIIIFTGSYENQNGDPNYIFNETGINLLPLGSNALNGIEIVKANFVTEQPQDGASSTMVNVRFSFWGFMNFKQQPFDLYSFGSPMVNDVNTFAAGDGLSYSNMAINMSFALQTSSVQFFTFDVNQMSFDLGQSIWRTGSLYGHFPLQLTGILTGDTTSQPSSQGYIPLPVTGMTSSSSWVGTWYGLVFNLNMGTMGDLTNSLGFNSTMMMVWTAGANGQLGAMIQLPGLSTQSKTLSLQSVLNLNIGNLQLQSAENQDGTAAYMMMMNQITLKFLSFSFPPSGAVNFYLFGDPDADAQPSSLGWYLGYQADS